MRTKHVVKNVNYSILYTIVNMVFSFISRTVFIYVLGSLYLGLNGILVNILSMLAITELGISVAIGYSLYKPLANNDTDKINSLMLFYKKAYSVIGIVIFALGLAVMPFLRYIISDMGEISNIYIIYLIYLINTAYIYFFSFKRTLITADQRKYILTKYLTVFRVIIYVSQIIVLYVTKSFIAYLLTQFFVSLIENIVVNRLVDKTYPYLDLANAKPIEGEDKKNIYTNVKAMMFHKIGDYIINGTDNIIISIYVSLTMVGIYSNYLMLITQVNTFLMLIFRSASSAFGNLIASETEDKIHEKFKTFDFIGFWIFGFSSLAFYFLFNPFIGTIWLNEEYLLSYTVVLVIVINFFTVSMRVPLSIVKSAAGVYKQDKFIPLIQGFVNLVFSIVLVQYMGLIGVFLGTMASNLLVVFWNRPYIVYKYVFKRPLFEYFIRQGKYMILLVIYALIIHGIFYLVSFDNVYIDFIFKVIVVLIIPNIFNIIIFRKDDEFKWVKETLNNIIRRRK